MLSQKDLYLAMNCVRKLVGASGHDEFVATALREIRPLLGAKLGGYNEADPVRKRFAFVVDPRELVSDEEIRAWVQFAPEHPLILNVQRNPEDFAVHKITDFVPQSQFRKTALCRNLYRIWGAEYQIAMRLPVPGPAAVAIVFNRGHDFTERDREMLTFLQPLVYLVYCSMQKMTDLQLALEESEAMAKHFRGSRADAINKLGLSRQKSAVLWRLLQGTSNKEIARKMKLSTRTVEKHVAQLLKVLKVPNRAVACATFREGAENVENGVTQKTGQGAPAKPVRCSE